MNKEDLTQEIKELKEYDEIQLKKQQQIQKAKEEFIITLSKALGVDKLLKWIDSKISKR